MEVKNDTLTEFQSTKLLFLKNSGYSKNTETTYWRLYLNNISDLEIELNKDLFEFSQEEIDCYKERIKQKSEQTIYQTNTFIRKYIEWYSDFYKRTDIKDLDLNIKKEKDNSSYISKDDFFDMFYNMLDNKISILNLIPLLFARYGILGKEYIYIRNIKWKDIRFRYKEVLIYNQDRNEIISHIPIDDSFIKAILEIRSCEKQQYKGQKVKNKYILKTQITENELANYASINSKITRSFTAMKMKRISLKTLFNSCLVDYVKNFYSSSLPKTNEELAEVLSLFYIEEKVDNGRIRTLKTLYVEVFDDTETLRTYGRVKSKNFSNTTRVFNRNNTIYTSEENYDFQLNKSKDTIINKIIIEENYAYIILEGTVENKKVKINKDIVHKVEDYKWHLNSSEYVVARKKIEERLAIIHLSNLILDKEEYFRIKHLNGDKLDCTSENLEVDGLY